MSKDYFQSEDFKALLGAYENREEKDRSIYLDAEDFADIADYYLIEDKPEDAMNAINMGLEIHPDEEVLLIMQSATYIYMREFDKAQDIVIRLDESNPDVKYQVAQLEYAKFGNVESAESIWRVWMDMENEENPDQEQQRECYLHIISSMVELHNTNESGNHEYDKDCVRRWIREYIDKFQPLGKYEEDVQLVDLCRESELPDLLAEMLTQVLVERPYLPKGWASLALSQFLMRQYEQALESCDFALAINPDSLEALLTKAHTLNEMGQGVLAKPIFKEYLDKGGDVVQIIPYADALFQDGEVEPAIFELQWLANYLEEQRDYHVHRMRTVENDKVSDEEYYKESGIYADFFDLYKKAYSDIGEVYHHHGYYKESIEVNDKILLVDNTCAESHFMLGINYLALEQYDTASKHFAHALQFAEDRVAMGLDIALTFVLNDFDLFALEVLNAISRIADFTKSPFANNIPAAKSLVYLKMGNTKLFLKSFRRACNDTPELIKRVYENYFPKDMSVNEWADYAEKETDALMEKIRKSNFYKKGFV